MAGSTGEEYGLDSQPSSVEGMSSGQGCQGGDTLVEWRSSEQVENGTPSTSPPYWDTDDDDDLGPKPSDLYGKFTWKIENFSQITKRELRSNVFEVGGHKWYILIYPQGCDVCNHLSLFLCVANHDKLLPGWSHFAQFTIAVVNKDSKKSKYSDTLHRFWKKEHDWGWKKFMELSKLSDGFIVADAVVIKAQVQVIRENTHRPFRCLDCQYRRELVRVYLSNVEQLCRRYVEEKRGKFNKIIEDKVRWSSFRSFWIGVDQTARRWMSRDKTETILKIVVKHFFIEKEVTSTLVMDSLYSGLKAIECQGKNNKGSAKVLEMEELSLPFVHVEKDMFILTDDVLLLLERAALDPILPKDEKASQNQNQNRTKDGSSGEEFTKDSIERDERRLTELGRRTVEIFVLNHIFSSRIEVAYQEAVALKRQEELIREEEAAGIAENELRLKRTAAEKEKRAKKKQAKQKRNNRKGKERVRDEKTDTIAEEKGQGENISDERMSEELSENPALSVPDNVADASDVSDGVDDVPETLQPEFDERDSSPVSWDAETSASHPVTETTNCEMQNEQAEKKSSSAMDDSSSTCSTDSIPSVVTNGPYKRNAMSSNRMTSSPSRGKTQQSRNTRDRMSQAFIDSNKLQSDCMSDAGRMRDAINCKTTSSDFQAVVLPSKDCTQRMEQHVTEKEEVVTLQKKLAGKDQIDEDRPSKPRISEQPSPAISVRSSSTLQQPKHIPESNVSAAEAVREPSSSTENQIEKSVSLLSRSPSSSKQEAKSTVSVKNAVTQQASAMSRPPSAPLIPAPKPMVPFVSSAQSVPLLSRSISAAGRLGADTSFSTQNNVLQSYRNAIMSRTPMNSSTPNFAPRPPSSTAGPATYAHPLPAFVPSPAVIPLQKPARMDHASVRPGLTFGSVNPESLQGRHLWTDESLQLESTTAIMHNANIVRDMQRLDVTGRRPSPHYIDDVYPIRQAIGVAQDEFPHLDIINDLLDEEQSGSRLGSSAFHHLHHPTLNRQYTFPGDISSATDVGTSNGSRFFDQMSQYYDGGISRFYGSTSGHVDLGSDQLDLTGYVNGQLDGVNRSQWPISSMDHSILGLGSADTNGYPYQIPDSSNMACGLNGYSMYRPANGL